MSTITTPRGHNFKHTEDAATCLVRRPEGYTFTHEQLTHLFKNYLPIHDIREVKTGFFLVLDNSQMVTQAIEQLHNRQLGPGWVMRVERAKIREWPLAAPQRKSSSEVSLSLGSDAQFSNNPNLSPLGSRKSARDDEELLGSTNLYIQGLPPSATWQSLKEWAATGHSENRFFTPFVDVWSERGFVEGRLGYRRHAEATEAKLALQKWPYEGKVPLITYHSQIPHAHSSGSKLHSKHDEASYYPEQTRKRPRSPEPTYAAEESKEDKQLLLDLKFARQRGHKLSKEDFLRAQTKEERTPLKKAKSDLLIDPRSTTTEEDKLAEALRLFREMDNGNTSTASYDWGTGKLVYGSSASPDKGDRILASKTHTPALTFDDTESSFASPEKYATRRRRRGDEIAWPLDEYEFSSHRRRASDARSEAHDAFEGRLPKQTQGVGDAGWERQVSESQQWPDEPHDSDVGWRLKVSEPQPFPLRDDRPMEDMEDRYGKRNRYADQSEVFALQNGKKVSQGFPEDFVRGFPDFSRRVPCRYFPNCKRGDSCAFLHEKAEPSLPFRDPAFLQQQQILEGRHGRNEGRPSGCVETGQCKHNDADRQRRESGDRRSSGDAAGVAPYKYSEKEAAAIDASAAAWGELPPLAQTVSLRASDCEWDQATEPRVEIDALPTPTRQLASRREQDRRSDERREARRAERLQRQAGLSLAETDPANQASPPADSPVTTKGSATSALTAQVPLLPKLKLKLKELKPSREKSPKFMQPLTETQQQAAPLATSGHDTNGMTLLKADAAQSESDELCRVAEIPMTNKVNEEVGIQEVYVVSPTIKTMMSVASKDESPWAY